MCDVYLLHIQFCAASIYSVRVFCSCHLLIGGRHAYQSTGNQRSVTERLTKIHESPITSLNFTVISLHCSRKQYDCTRFPLLLPTPRSFGVSRSCGCSLFERRSITKWHIWKGLIHEYTWRHRNWFPAARVVLAVFSASCWGKETGTWGLCLDAKCSARFETPSLSFEVTLWATLAFCWEFIVNLTAFHASLERRWGNVLING